jgi:hypothetical protein
MKSTKILLFIVGIVGFALLQSLSFAIGVEPMKLDFLVKPGDTVPFEINVIATGKSDETQLMVYQAIQKLDGRLDFLEAAPGSFPALSWLTLPSQVSVKEKERAAVKGVIKVPLNAPGGTYSMAIIIEPQADQSKRRFMTFKIRYAVRVDIRVDRVGLRPLVKINQFEMVKGENGEPLIQVLAQNVSPMDFLSSATVTIRDSQKKLVEKVELKPQYSWDINNIDTRIYPGAELLYYGRPNVPLLPGQYELRLFYRYASAGQIMQTKLIGIKEGDFNYPKAKLKAVRISPLEIEFTGKPGTASIKAVKFENKYDKPVIITTEIVEISSNYPYSILNNTEVKLKDDKQFIMEPGRMHVSILSLKFPSNTIQEVNYGLLQIKVYTAEEKPTLLEDSTILLSSAIPGDHKRTAEATSLFGVPDGNNQLFSLMIKNTGNIKIVPVAEAVVTDQKGKLVDTIRFAIEGEENAAVFPARVMTLTGSAKSFRPGKYNADIKIFDNGTVIGISKVTLEVK